MARIGKRLTRRFSTLGLLSDIALVGAAATRLFQRNRDPRARNASATEMALAGGAVLRLVQRLRRRRRARRSAV